MSIAAVSEPLSQPNPTHPLPSSTLPATALVVGGTSLVGRHVLRRLSAQNFTGVAFSRQAEPNVVDTPNGFVWSQTHATVRSTAATPSNGGRSGGGLGEHGPCVLLTLAPITVVPPLLEETSEIQAVIALSTSSVFFKGDSADPKERQFVTDVLEAENAIKTICADRGIPWTILRPTLVYDPGRDMNVSAVARFIQRFKLFPIINPASGERQPVHADDVAHAMVAALSRSEAQNKVFALPGGETVTYREMVRRVFAAMSRTPRIMPIPVWPMRIGFRVWKALTGSTKYSVENLTRMNRDLTVDGAEAITCLGFEPRKFEVETGAFER